MFLVKNVFWRPIANTRFFNQNSNTTIQIEKIKQKIATNSPDLRLNELQFLLVNSQEPEKVKIFKSHKHFILKNLHNASMLSLSGFIIHFGKSKIIDDTFFSSLRHQFVVLSEKGLYCKYSLSAAVNFLIRNPNDTFIYAYVAKIIKDQTYDKMDLIQATVHMSRIKEHSSAEMFVNEIPKCHEVLATTSFVPEVLRFLAKEKYQNNEFYIKVAENIEKCWLKNPSIGVTKIFTAYALIYFENNAITKALDFLMEKYHSILSTRSLSNIFHEIISCPPSILSPKSWDILKAEIEGRDNLADSLWDLSSIFHCYKKLSFDMKPLFKHITEENLERANGQQLAVIIFSIRRDCNRDYLPWLKKLTLKKIDDMHGKSAMMTGLFWSEDFNWDKEFWDEFEPILNRKLESLDVNERETQSLGMFRSIGARLVRLRSVA